MCGVMCGEGTLSGSNVNGTRKWTARIFEHSSKSNSELGAQFLCFLTFDVLSGGYFCSMLKASYREVVVSLSYTPL